MPFGDMCSLRNRRDLKIGTVSEYPFLNSVDRKSP